MKYQLPLGCLVLSLAAYATGPTKTVMCGVTKEIYNNVGSHTKSLDIDASNNCASNQLVITVFDGGGKIVANRELKPGQDETFSFDVEVFGLVKLTCGAGDGTGTCTYTLSRP